MFRFFQTLIERINKAREEERQAKIKAERADEYLVSLPQPTDDSVAEAFGPQITAVLKDIRKIHEVLSFNGEELWHNGKSDEHKYAITDFLKGTCKRSADNLKSYGVKPEFISDLHNVNILPGDSNSEHIVNFPNFHIKPKPYTSWDGRCLDCLTEIVNGMSLERILRHLTEQLPGKLEGEARGKLEAVIPQFNSPVLITRFSTAILLKKDKEVDPIYRASETQYSFQEFAAKKKGILKPETVAASREARAAGGRTGP